MQKFILLRGHQGSGKSTFAEQKIAEFQKEFPNAQIVHIENDKELTDENGVYHFSREALVQAQQKGMAVLKNTLKFGQQHKQNPILIINSNTNQKANACRSLLDLAKKFVFETEVYRLHNFYPNLHNVPENDVLAAYFRLNQNRVKGEIHVPAEQPISAAQQAAIDEMGEFHRMPLDFDETQQTYVTRRFLQCGQRDFTAKTSKKYPELRVLKYRSSVFYENRFNNALLEMRGLVVDAHGRIIVRPFKKVFNYSERIAKNSKYPIEISENHLVDAVVKVNGFLGVCTHVCLPEDHPSDVHIIREEFGATLIGIVEVATGRQWREDELDKLAAQYGLKRPQTIKNITFGALQTLLKTVEHEGFMVFDAESKEMLFKLKSPYYLISKFLGRSKSDNLGRKLDKRQVDEEFYPLIDHIAENKAYFNELGELEKIAFIQEFLQKVQAA